MQGPEFVVEFFRILPRSLKHSLKHFDEPTRARVNRLVAVWDERKVRTRAVGSAADAVRNLVLCNTLFAC